MQQDKEKRHPILILLGIAALIAALVLILSKTAFGRHICGNERRPRIPKRRKPI